MAIARIRHILEEDRDTNWNMPDPYAIGYAQEIAKLPPDEAMARALAVIRELEDKNRKEDQRREEARRRRDYILAHPITNASMFGLIPWLRRFGLLGRILSGFLSLSWRSFLATLVGNPTVGLNVLEVDRGGLQIYQPFATVSQRTIKFKDIDSREITISPDPADYFDLILGQLRQFMKEVPIPWGSIIIYERGSGRNIATAVAVRPDKKVKQIREALQALHLLEFPYADHKRLPRLIDLFIYYDVDNPPAASASNPVNSPAPDPPANRQSGFVARHRWLTFVLLLLLLFFAGLLLPMLR
jgi:hypothetical protein